MATCLLRGGRGFRPKILENLILRYELNGKVRTRPKIVSVALGPCAQFCPGEASEQKWGQKPKSTLKEIELLICHHSIRLKKTNNLNRTNVKIG